MRFLRDQAAEYRALEGDERLRWVLAWLGVAALIVGFVAFFAWLIISGEILKESNATGGP